MVKTLRIASAPDRAALPLDPARIGGISAALALHVIACGLLLVPTQLPMQPAQAEPRTRYEPVFRTPPPPPPPTETVPVVRQPPTQAKPSTSPPIRQANASLPDAPGSTATAVIDPPIVAPDGGGDSLPPPGAGENVGGSGGPVSGMTLQYLSNPPPAYPRDALRDGLQGTVMLRVVVDAQGRPLEVSVEATSGHRMLDRAAREQVLRRWRFVPARHNGQAVSAIGLVPVDFRID